MSPPGSRAGLSAVELVVALVLLAGLVGGSWRVFASQRRAAEELRARTEVLDADRAVRVILAAELAAGVPGRDWWLRQADVVELRAFRGWAARCAGADRGIDEIVVAYRGMRLPDPEKDSVLALLPDGRWSVAALVGRTGLAPECPGTTELPAPDARIEAWRLDPPLPDAILLRTFERGSYHLEDGSLRYRRGAAGRQPLTPPVLDPLVSGLGAGPGDTSVVLTVAGAAGRGGEWTRILRGNSTWPP